MLRKIWLTNLLGMAYSGFYFLAAFLFTALATFAKEADYEAGFDDPFSVFCAANMVIAGCLFVSFFGAYNLISRIEKTEKPQV